MHSFTAPSGITYRHNGDFSGGIQIPDEEIQQFARNLHIPFEDIRALYLAYLRQKMISVLETITDEELEQRLSSGIWPLAPQIMGVDR